MSEVLTVLVQLWPQDVLLYVFQPWHLISWVLHRVAGRWGHVILKALDWLRCPWYMDLVHLRVTAPWQLPMRLDLSVQGLVQMPEMTCFLLTAWLLRGHD